MTTYIRRCVKVSGCFFICLHLVSCVGLYASKYNFPPEVQKSHIEDMFFDNGNFLFWNDVVPLAPVYKERKEYVLTKLKQKYPIGLKIEVAKRDLLQSGFTCKQNMADETLNCQVKALSTIWQSAWPFPGKCLTINERKIEVIFLGDLHIEDVEVTQHLRAIPCT